MPRPIVIIIISLFCETQTYVFSYGFLSYRAPGKDDEALPNLSPHPRACAQLEQPG